MSFHRNLNGKDLHSPTYLPIENDGITNITKGDVLVVSEFNSDSKRYRVIRVADGLDLRSRAPIFGIAEEDLAGSLDKGRMITFGVAENVSITLTKNTESAMDVSPLVEGNLVYIDNRPLIPDTTDPNPNVGKLVSGGLGKVEEAAVIINITSTTTATVFFYGIAVGITGLTPDRASLLTIEFDTLENQAGQPWEPNTPDTNESTGTLVHGLDTTDYVVQWYEYTYDGSTITKTQTIDLDWFVDGSNAIKAILPITFGTDRIRGRVEIIY